MAGGALLQEVNLTQQIFNTLVNAIKKPVTLKIRSGVTNALLENFGSMRLFYNLNIFTMLKIWAKKFVLIIWTAIIISITIIILRF